MALNKKTKGGICRETHYQHDWIRKEICLKDILITNFQKILI